MEKKLFGHRSKKRSHDGRVPGEPFETKQYDQGDESETSHRYVESKDFPDEDKKNSYGKSKDGPANYEGKEHIKYKNAGFSTHQIRYPEDEPHMKSSNDSNESHEMEDNYHMSVPNQTEYTLEEKLKRARMKMDAPDQQEPDRLRGNLVHNEDYEGDEDTSGEEEMGPNNMQSKTSKESRKKMIVAITRKKMGKKRM